MRECEGPSQNAFQQNNKKSQNIISIDCNKSHTHQLVHALLILMRMKNREKKKTLVCEFDVHCTSLANFRKIKQIFTGIVRTCKYRNNHDFSLFVIYCAQIGIYQNGLLSVQMSSDSTNVFNAFQSNTQSSQIVIMKIKTIQTKTTDWIKVTSVRVVFIISLDMNKVQIKTKQMNSLKNFY